jgi:hypothetical protein
MLNRDVGGISQALRNNENGTRRQPAITAIAIRRAGLKESLRMVAGDRQPPAHEGYSDLDKINIQFTLFSAFYSPLISTMSGGFLKAEGLDPEWSISPPGVSALAA